jgi:hypothetical protein
MIIPCSFQSQNTFTSGIQGIREHLLFGHPWNDSRAIIYITEGICIILLTLSIQSYFSETFFSSYTAMAISDFSI